MIIKHGRHIHEVYKSIWAPFSFPLFRVLIDWAIGNSDHMIVEFYFSLLLGPALRQGLSLKFAYFFCRCRKSAFLRQ